MIRERYVHDIQIAVFLYIINNFCVIPCILSQNILSKWSTIDKCWSIAMQSVLYVDFVYITDYCLLK